MTSILEALSTLSETTKLVILGGGLMILGFVLRRIVTLLSVPRPDRAGNIL
jgi:hypothetical protein